MRSEVINFVRPIIAILMVVAVIILLESALSLVFLPAPWWTFFTFEPVESQSLLTGLNRNFNQLLGIVFSTVAIAVPLTANMYSVKFLDLFIKDRINLAVLALVAFAGLNHTLLIHNAKQDYLPLFQFYISLALYVLIVSLLIPYLFYVFRFLHPNTLLRRLEAAIHEDLASAQRRPAHMAARVREVADSVEQIASVGLRSVDRADRTTAIESIMTLRRVMQGYWESKSRMPDSWFELGAHSFQGLAPEVVQELRVNRTWMEMQLFSQLRAGLNTAVPRMHDMVNAIANVTASLGLEPEARRSPPVEEMVMEYFNTFVRLGINRRDARTLYTLFYQYRAYAEGILLDRPEVALQIVYYFQYYAQVAREQGLTFVVETIAHDMAMLVQRAWERAAPNRGAMLERFLQFDRLGGARPMLGVKKAQAILAGYFLLNELPEEAERIRQSLQGLDPFMIETMRDDLLMVRREKYWEITERRLNMDYVVEAHREKVAEFLASLS